MLTPIVYLFIDGMTETSGQPTSLSTSRTPNIDAVFSAGSAGYYDPPVSAWDTEPRTDVVLPAFFGLGPELNPGRPALELADQGVDLVPGTNAFFVTVSRPERESDRLNERLQLISADETIAAAAQRLGATAIPSIAYNYGRRWVVGNCPPGRVVGLSQRIINLVGEDAVAEDVHVVSGGFTSLKATRPEICFLGWAKGALRGAFVHLGAETNPYNRPERVYGDLAALRRDFETFSLPAIKKRQRSATSYVLYTKETAFASRRDDRPGKVAAIEFMDGLLGRVVEALDGEALVVVASDHSCDIGGTSNPPARTSFALSRATPRTFVQSSQMHFDEETVGRACSFAVIPQAELINRIHYLNQK